MAISHAQSLVLFLVSLLILPAFADNKFQACKPGYNYPVKVETLKISPYPVQRSGNANITITGYTSIEIPDEATVLLDLSVRLIPAGKNYYSLCDITACPVSPGPIVFTLPNVFTKKQLRAMGYMVSFIIAEDKEHLRKPMMCVAFPCSIKGRVSMLRQVTE